MSKEVWQLSKGFMSRGMCSDHAKKKHGQGKAKITWPEIIDLPVVMEDDNNDDNIVQSGGDGVKLVQPAAKRQKISS